MAIDLRMLSRHACRDCVTSRVGISLLRWFGPGFCSLSFPHDAGHLSLFGTQRTTFGTYSRIGHNNIAEIWPGGWRNNYWHI